MNVALKLPEKTYRFELKKRIHEMGYILQSDFCKDIGLSTGILSRVLRGYTPNSDSLEKIAKGLRLTRRQLEELL
jgi:predicted transcriptional regulator